ncbi:MAG: GNAT family N-acetyltransferase [Pseudomonadota bacterium]|nr:GNAT family N-acetyltransferase [Pseudomonadota bacterium]
MPSTSTYREWILAKLKNSTDITYTALTPDHFAAVLELGNRVQGEGYLNLDNLTDYYQRGLKDGINAGIVAFYRDQLVGFRLTFAQGQWDIDQWATPAEWDVEPATVCYFKCNTVDPAMQGYGIGSTLLSKAVDAAQRQGSNAGLAHIWLASPGNSAFKYFSKNGGRLIKEHPNKWQYAAMYEGYDCPVCDSLCACVAAEMLLTFSQQ